MQSFPDLRTRNLNDTLSWEPMMQCGNEFLSIPCEGRFFLCIIFAPYKTKKIQHCWYCSNLCWTENCTKIHCFHLAISHSKKIVVTHVSKNVCYSYTLVLWSMIVLCAICLHFISLLLFRTDPNSQEERQQRHMGWTGGSWRSKCRGRVWSKTCPRVCANSIISTKTLCKMNGW